MFCHYARPTDIEVVRDVIYKLLGFTFAMVVVPIGSYFFTLKTVFSGTLLAAICLTLSFSSSPKSLCPSEPLQHALRSPTALPPWTLCRTRWTELLLFYSAAKNPKLPFPQPSPRPLLIPSGNATYAGAFAAIMANVVLISYIVVAMREEDETKSLEKKGQ